MIQASARTPSRSELRSRIVTAAARMLGEQGPPGVTTRGVAEAAGVQAPTIYRLFGDKDGLLDAVAEHELARYVTAKSGTEDGPDPIEDLHAAWDRHIRFGLDHPAVFTLLADPDRASRSAAGAAGRDVLSARVHRIAAAGRLRVPERRAVELIHAAGTGAVLTLLGTPVEQRDPHLVEALYDAVMRTVLTDARTPPHGTPDTGGTPDRGTPDRGTPDRGTPDRGTADNPTVEATAATAVTAAIALRAVAPDLPAFTSGERELLIEWLDRISTS